MDLHAVDDLLAHKGHSNEKLEEVDELLQHGAKISQQTTYIGGEKTLGEVIVGEGGDMDSRKSHAAGGDGDDDDDDE